MMLPLVAPVIQNIGPKLYPPVYIPGNKDMLKLCGVAPLVAVVVNRLHDRGSRLHELSQPSPLGRLLSSHCSA